MDFRPSYRAIFRSAPATRTKKACTDRRVAPPVRRKKNTIARSSASQAWPSLKVKKRSIISVLSLDAGTSRASDLAHSAFHHVDLLSRLLTSGLPTELAWTKQDREDQFPNEKSRVKQSYPRKGDVLKQKKLRRGEDRASLSFRVETHAVYGRLHEDPSTIDSQ